MPRPRPIPRRTSRPMWCAPATRRSPCCARWAPISWKCARRSISTTSPRTSAKYSPRRLTRCIAPTSRTTRCPSIRGCASACSAGRGSAPPITWATLRSCARRARRSPRGCTGTTRCSRQRCRSRPWRSRSSTKRRRRWPPSRAPSTFSARAACRYPRDFRRRACRSACRSSARRSPGIHVVISGT